MDPKYTQAQREAAIWLINDDGLHPKDAVEVLRTKGTNTVAPFDMPAETARKYAQRARGTVLTPLAQGDTTTAMDQLVKRGISWADTQLSRGITDPDTIRRIYQTLIDIDKLAKANKPRKTNNGETGNEPTPATKLTRLANTLNTPPQPQKQPTTQQDQHPTDTGSVARTHAA